MKEKKEARNEKPETKNVEEILEELFQSSNPKVFVKRFKALEADWKDPSNFIRQVASSIPLKLYEKFYDDLVPHSFFGLSCASSTLDLFPEERRWWPFVQQAWFIARERKRATWDGTPRDIVALDSPEEGWNHFQKFLSNRDFGRCFALLRGFLSDPLHRDFFRTQSLDWALRDTAHGGLKFIQLAKAWEMAEIVGWQDADQILFPSFHFLVLGPCRDELATRVGAAGQLVIPDQPGEPVSPADLRELENKVLYSDDSIAALDGLARLAGQGHGFSSIHEALLLIATQALNNAQMGRWLSPLRAFLYTESCRVWAQRVPAKEQGKGLELACLLIQRASGKSRENPENRVVLDLAESVCPMNPFSTLRSLVSHSDPYASANTVLAIVRMGTEAFEELTQTLVTLAAKNDARVGQGYDLLLVQACAEAYQRSKSELRERFPVSCGFFLGRMLKNYELFGAYGV